MAGADWTSNIERKIDLIFDKLDDSRKENVELWQRYQDEISKVRTDVRDLEKEHAERLSAHATELSNWRWALLICLGMVITAVMNFVLAQYSLKPINPSPDIESHRPIR